MLNKNIWLDVTLLFIIVCAIFPLIYIVDYVYLSSDDFCRASLVDVNYLKKIKNWYLNHNGRYSNAIFGSLPIYDLYSYRISLKILLGFNFIAVFIFIRTLFRQLEIKNLNRNSFFLSGLFFITIVSQVPSVFSFFYWYAAASSYLLSLSILLLFYCNLIEKRKSLIKAILNFLLIFLLIGNNELNMPLVILPLCSLIIYKNLKFKLLDWHLISATFWSLACTLFVYFSPGSKSRINSFEKNVDFINAIYESFLSSGMFILKSFFEIQYFAFYILITLLIFVTNKKKIRLSINPLFLLICSILCFWGVLFLMVYATGFLEVNKGRVGNYIHYIFLVILVCNIFNLAVYLSKFSFYIKIQEYSVKIMLIITILLNILIGENYRKIYKDFRDSEFQRIENDIANRIKDLKTVKGEIVQIKSIKPTNILNFDVFTKHEVDWLDDCFLSYINKSADLKLINIDILE